MRWLYLEWARLADETRPTRQLVFRVAEDGQRMTTTVYRLPGDAARYAGEWRRAKPFESLRPEDLQPVEGCRLLATRTMLAHFTVVTEGNRCPGDLAGAAYMRFEFSFSSSELSLLEQPRDAAGNVPKSRLEPIEFVRMSETPK